MSKLWYYAVVFTLFGKAPMNFVTLEFAAFFLVVLFFGGLLRHNPGPYRVILLCCNLFFYASAGIIFVPLLLGVAFLNWGTARLLFSLGDSRRRARKSVIALNIAIHIALLAFFKYYEFLLLGLESLCGFMGFGNSRSRRGLPGYGHSFSRRTFLLHLSRPFLCRGSISYAGTPALLLYGCSAFRVLFPYYHGRPHYACEPVFPSVATAAI